MTQLIASITTHKTRLQRIKFLIIDRIDINIRHCKNNLNRKRKKRKKNIKFCEINSRLIFSFDNAKNLIFVQITNKVDFQTFYRFYEILDNQIYFLYNHEKRIYYKKSESVFFAQILNDKLIAREFVYYCIKILDDLTRRFQFSHNNVNFLHDNHRIVKKS